MIFIGFQPNACKKDLGIALSFLLLPWKWVSLRKGIAIQKAEEWLKNFFDSKYCVTFDSGRTALQKGLEAFGISKGDEVLVQGYTCVVVVNAIKWAGGSPVYVDITRDLIMDPQDLEHKITDKSKVLIIQHTFGKSADLEKLLAVTKKYNLKVIEDCAHTIGGNYYGKKLGTFGDIGMFSFGSDKVVSSVRGGALICNDEFLGNKIQALQSKLPLSTRTKILQYLINIPVFMLLKPLYQYGIGKWILAVCKKLNITGRIMYEKEKRGEQVSFYPSKFPNALAELLVFQLEDLDEMNAHRKELGDIYMHGIEHKKILPILDSDTIPLRFNVLVEDPKKLQKIAQESGIVLGNWYDDVITPCSIGIEGMGYKSGECRTAEKYSKMSVNLPTNRNISTKDALKIIELINNFVK